VLSNVRDELPSDAVKGVDHAVNVIGPLCRAVGSGSVDASAPVYNNVQAALDVLAQIVRKYVPRTP
jgi:hypothetical protein